MLFEFWSFIILFSTFVAGCELFSSFFPLFSSHPHQGLAYCLCVCFFNVLFYLFVRFFVCLLGYRKHSCNITLGLCSEELVLASASSICGSSFIFFSAIHTVSQFSFLSYFRLRRNALLFYKGPMLCYKLLFV